MACVSGRCVGLSALWLVCTFFFLVLFLLMGNYKASLSRDCPFFDKKYKFAHRGYVNRSQENTIKAALDSYDHGFLPEFDVWLTKDGHLVIWHDTNGVRMAGDERTIAEMTLAEVRTLEIKSTIGQKKYASTASVPTYKEYLAAICSPGNEDRIFVVDLNFVDSLPLLTARDKRQAELSVSDFAESSCTSQDVIFSLGHPLQGPAMRTKMKEFGMKNPLIFWFVPDTWPLGEEFWIKNRLLVALADVDGAECHSLLWDHHRDDLLKLKENKFCVGAFGSGAAKHCDYVQMCTLDADAASCELMDGFLYESPITYSGGGGGVYEWFMLALAALVVCTLGTFLLPVAIYKGQQSSGAAVGAAS
eukprot:NODE_1227_length_1204_cov_11.489991.p1 GENE.NODE_1227_length_1204_cov_11.489991~~NODE_1227_length_1204_cov_11.489991.p1  ORF type:complete len:361 (+),score=87.44 NODE_1227_length_1204_cov_11.489991:82-1164(+)